MWGDRDIKLLMPQHQNIARTGPLRTQRDRLSIQLYIASVKTQVITEKGIRTVYILSTSSNITCTQSIIYTSIFIEAVNPTDENRKKEKPALPQIQTPTMVM